MKKYAFPLMMASVLFILLSCNKDKESTNLNYQLQTSNRSVAVNRVAGGSMNWTSGSAFVDKIEFEAEKNDDVEIRFESDANRRIDLFAPVANLGNITLPDGKYDEIELEIDLMSTGTDTSFVLRGAYTNSTGQTTPVLFFISDVVEFETEADNVTINGGNQFTALTTLDLSLLTSGISESQLNAATRTNGVIVISKNSNSGLYNSIISVINSIDEVELDD